MLLISLLLILLFILFLTCLLLEIHLALEVMLMAGVCDGATVLRIYLDVLWRGLAWGCARRTACRPSYGVVARLWGPQPCNCMSRCRSDPAA